MTEQRGGKDFDVNEEFYNVDVDKGGLNVDEGGLNVDEGGYNVDERGTTPKIGMEFNSLNELCEFYKIYAKEVVFPFRKGSSRKNVHGDIRSYSILCAREGHNDSTSNKPLRPQATIRCGCQARIMARLCLGKWVISTLDVGVATATKRRGRPRGRKNKEVMAMEEFRRRNLKGCSPLHSRMLWTL